MTSLSDVVLVYKKLFTVTDVADKLTPLYLPYKTIKRAGLLVASSFHQNLFVNIYCSSDLQLYGVMFKEFKEIIFTSLSQDLFLLCHNCCK